MGDAATYGVPHRDVRTRRIRFSYPTGSRFQHYVDGDLVMSHIVAVLSGMFPEGEQFFVRSVRDARDRVTDPSCARRWPASSARRSPTAVSTTSSTSGSPRWATAASRSTGTSRKLLALVERIGSRRRRLAVTAALEHYTATLAECLLEKPEAQALLGDTEVRSLLL